MCYCDFSLWLSTNISLNSYLTNVSWRLFVCAFPSESSEWAGSFHKQEEHNQLGGEKNERSLVKKKKKKIVLTYSYQMCAYSF